MTGVKIVEDRMVAFKDDERIEEWWFGVKSTRFSRGIDTMPLGVWHKGIYTLERDTLTLCVSPRGFNRPTTLDGKGPGEPLLVLKRMKPRPARPDNPGR